MAIEKVIDVEAARKGVEAARKALLPNPYCPSASDVFEKAKARLRRALQQEEFYSKQVALGDLLEPDELDVPRGKTNGQAGSEGGAFQVRPMQEGKTRRGNRNAGG